MNLSDTHPEESLPVEDDFDEKTERQHAIDACIQARAKDRTRAAEILHAEIGPALKELRELIIRLISHEDGDWHEEHDDFPPSDDRTAVCIQTDQAVGAVENLTALLRPYLPKILPVPPGQEAGFRYGVVYTRDGEQIGPVVLHGSRELAEASVAEHRARTADPAEGARLVYFYQRRTVIHPVPAEPAGGAA